MYKIAKYLTPKQVDRALAHEYTPRPNMGPPDGIMVPVDEGGYCPLGRAFEGDMTDDLLEHLDGGHKRPAPEDVSAILDAIGRTDHLDPSDDGWSAACEFTDDWDTGKITDLAEALGRGGQ